jgi:hypothetical protein
MNAYELPYLYWIPKLLRYIAGSSKCSTKTLLLLLILLTDILTTAKEKLQTYCAITLVRIT